MYPWSMNMLGKFALWCLGLLVLAEGILRLMPVSQGFYLDNITPDQPIARRLGNREATSSIGWKMSEPVSIPINAQGFIYADDFNAETNKHLTIMIGDSQIEAPLIPWEQSLANGLESRFKGDMAVYPVGMSGAPLSQYLIWYQHMATIYRPETVVFFVSSNDFVESFEAYGLFPGFHYFSEDANGTVSLNLRAYQRGIVGRMASSSSLLAYVLNNLDGISFLASVWNSGKHVISEQARKQLTASALSGTLTSEDDSINRTRQEKGRQAIGLFFERLPRNDQGKANIVFAMNPDTQKDELSDQFRTGAQAYGYSVIELGKAFDQSILAHGQALTFEGDVHWNRYGQAVVADTVAPYLCVLCN
jgi:hypothetical protein